MVGTWLSSLHRSTISLQAAAAGPLGHDSVLVARDSQAAPSVAGDSTGRDELEGA